MKVYDIIDKRETPAKKITIAHEGDACDVAREYCGKSLLLHFPVSDGNGGAVVRWFGTYSLAVIVKPARVIEERDPLRDLYEKATNDERIALDRLRIAEGIEDTERALDRYREARAFADGVSAAIKAVKEAQQ